MRTIRTLGIVLLPFGLAGTAEAAAPKVAGTYAFLGYHICQTVIHTPTSPVSNVTGALKVKGVTNIFKSTKDVVAALTPASDTFLKPGNTQGSAIVNLGPTPGTVIQDVGPTSRIDFVTQVQTQSVAAVTAVEPDWTAGANGNSAGTISVTVGTVTFPAVASSSGTASVSTVEVLGHSMRNDNPANNVGFTRNPTSTGSASFTLTAATATIGNNTYDFSAGNIVNGVARTINLVRRPKTDEYCVDVSTLTKQ